MENKKTEKAVVEEPKAQTEKPIVRSIFNGIFFFLFH